MSATSTTARPSLPASARVARAASEQPAITQFTPTTWAATSSDPSRAPYKVERHADGSLTCTCEGNALWGKVCRHIKAVAAQYPAPAPALSWDERRAAAQHPFMCAGCGQVRAIEGSLLCRRCRRTREVADLLHRDYLQDEADRAALEEAAAHRPLSAGHGWN